MSEDELALIERATDRPPDWVLFNLPTLQQHAGGGVELFVEPLYWGVREMVAASRGMMPEWRRLRRMCDSREATLKGPRS